VDIVPTANMGEVPVSNKNTALIKSNALVMDSKRRLVNEH
jgi:hypothetical protein